ncbi:hypothetical protein [Tardiphaga sp. 709]|uniref:hypothetical protein n=1 Tax=Tardiphaga sp. 709 TaxID=3076039 RepID=UPI0028E70124|nr:hypothetical protein [Tardiphaga sp. 709]WNV07465.1 hypothetical protein RSO67_18220 [Tardiphaga sp. 709]
MNDLGLCRSIHGDLESQHDQIFASHGECVVTISFCETAANIRRDDAIASDIRIAIDGGISFSDGAADEWSRANRLRLMVCSRY